MGSSGGLDVGCERKKWRMASEGGPDPRRMKRTSADMQGNHRRTGAGAREIRNSVLDLWWLWGWTYIQGKMLSGDGEWGVYSERSSGLGEVLSDVAGVSMVLLDQITRGVNADTVEMRRSEPWALKHLIHMEELEKESNRTVRHDKEEEEDVLEVEEGISRRNEGLPWWSVAQMVKNLPAMQGTWIWSLGGEGSWLPTPVFLPGKAHGGGVWIAKSQTWLSN